MTYVKNRPVDIIVGAVSKFERASINSLMVVGEVKRKGIVLYDSSTSSSIEHNNSCDDSSKDIYENIYRRYSNWLKDIAYIKERGKSGSLEHFRAVLDKVSE